VIARALPLLLLFAACQKHAPEPAAPAPPAPAAAPTLPETPAPAAPQHAARVPAEVTRFRDLARAYGDQPVDPQHPALIEALRSLADGFEALPQGRERVGDAANRIRVFADRIEESGGSAIKHAEWARAAFEEAADAFVRLDLDNTEMDAHVDAIRAAAASITPSQPLVEQNHYVDQALRETAEALWFAAGGKVEAVGV
jgi:hypothetical protein